MSGFCYEFPNQPRRRNGDCTPNSRPRATQACKKGGEAQAVPPAIYHKGRYVILAPDRRHLVARTPLRAGQRPLMGQKRGAPYYERIEKTESPIPAIAGRPPVREEPGDRLRLRYRVFESMWPGIESGTDRLAWKIINVLGENRICRPLADARPA